MFIQQKNNAIYRVSLTLDRVLSPFWDLSKSLLKDRLLSDRIYFQFDPDFEQAKTERMQRCDELFQKRYEEITQGEGFDEDKQKALAQEERSKYDTVFAEAFQLILNHYMKKILSPDCFRRQIRKSCSLIVYKPEGECRFVAEGGNEGFDKEFRNCLFSLKIIEEFLKFLNGGNTDSNSFNPKIYAYIFPDNFDDDAVSIASPLYSKDNLVAKDTVVRQTSAYNIWYNDSILKSLGYDGSHEGDVYEYRAEDILIALEQGDYIIPMVTEWLTYFNVTNLAQVLWTDYQSGIFNNIERIGEKKSKPAKMTMTNDEKAFVQAAASEDFTNILSHLVDNLYLPDNAPALEVEYQKFFHDLMKVEELKHLVDYKLYVPNHDQPGTVLGVYKIHKLQGETDYNLRHMLYSQQNGDQQVFKDYNEESRNVTIVQVLKPQYASFYMMDYYEFFVEEILKDLKEQGVIKGYLRNQKFCYKEADGKKLIEIDALVFNGQKIYFLELKTTLHIEFLNTYPQRYAALLDNEKTPDIYEFYLISSFAEDNIAILRPEQRDGYNVKREGLKSIPYKFDVGIPVKGDVKRSLHCLSESSFDRLRAELQRVFTA